MGSKDLGNFDKCQIVMARLCQNPFEITWLVGYSRSEVVNTNQKSCKKQTTNRQQGAGHPRFIVSQKCII